MNPYSYPKLIRLNDGMELIIRPLRKDDEKALHSYFLKLPPEEVARLKDDITDPALISKWIFDLDYDAVLPLVAIDRDHIVANGTLKFNPIGWRKHQGEIRTTVDPEYREKGLSTLLIENLIEIANTMGLEQLTAELAPTLDEAYFLFEKMGFKEAAVLKNFIKDQEGRYEDLVVMIMDLK
ncbi:MAG: GNAT family N-acetyltransferase [Desulfobacterales bacterium]